MAEITDLRRFQEEKLLAVRRHFVAELESLRKRLRAQQQAEFEVAVKHLEEKTQAAIERMKQDFETGLAFGEDMRKKGMNSRTIDIYEESIRKSFESGVEFQQKLLRDFIARWGPKST